MAKTRFNLNETMQDAVQGIQEAKAIASKIEEDLQATRLEDSNTPIPDIPEKENNLEAKNYTNPINNLETSTTEAESSRVEGPADTKINRLRKKIRKIDNDKRILRNVYLDEETLEKFETIKRKMNRGKGKEKKDSSVFVTDLLNLAAIEFLDKYYKDFA